MIRKLLLTSTLIFSGTILFAQIMKAIEVADNTFKIKAGEEETFYYGFAEGDKIVFSFEEKKGKELKEIEIIELPSTSKFMDFKTSGIGYKELEINKTGVYKFRFANSALSGRVCAFHLQRIPANESTKFFNTNVIWEDRHDTIFYAVEESYLMRTDTVIQIITDQIAKVHSATNVHGNRTTFNFSLPANTVAWSYYVGVDQAGQEVLEQATIKLTKFAGPILARLSGYGPMAAIALGGASYITLLQKGEDIDYDLVSPENQKLFLAKQPYTYLKKGKVINDFSRMTEPLQGNYHFCFLNDNAITGVSVFVNITAITVTEYWGMHSVQKYQLKPKKVPVLRN